MDDHLVEIEHDRRAAVDHEEGELQPDALGMDDHRRLEPHLAREERSCRLRARPSRDRQREGQLHHAVTGGVAVGAHMPARRGRSPVPLGCRRAHRVLPLVAVDSSSIVAGL